MNRKEVTWKDLCESATAEQCKIENTPDESILDNFEEFIENVSSF